MITILDTIEQLYLTRSLFNGTLTSWHSWRNPLQWFFHLVSDEAAVLARL